MKVLNLNFRKLQLFSCSKDKTKFVSNDLRGVFYYEDGSGGITYLEAPNFGFVLYRSNTTIDDDYTFEDLVDDDLCQFKVYTNRTTGDKYIKIFTEESYYLQTIVDNTLSKEDWIVAFEEGDNWGDIQGDESFQFKVHKVGEEDGDDLYVIESMKKPGFYFTHGGHGLAAKGVLLSEFDKKEKAPTFKLYTPKGTFIEGDIRLVEYEISGEY
jgi:hypothetical protein